jgi:hypothetical protein
MFIIFYLNKILNKYFIIIIILNTIQIMKKNKNQHENKHKIKYDKSNKKHFKNKCLTEDNNEDKATNREILEKFEIVSKNLPFPHKNKNEQKNSENVDENSIEEVESNSDDSNEEEEDEIKKENFNLKLFMLVIK